MYGYSVKDKRPMKERLSQYHIEGVRKELEYLGIDAFMVEETGIKVTDDGCYKEAILITFKTVQDMNLYKLTGYHSGKGSVLFETVDEPHSLMKGIL